MNNDKTILSVAVTLVLLGSIFFVIERVYLPRANRVICKLCPARLRSKSCWWAS